MSSCGGPVASRAIQLAMSSARISALTPSPALRTRTSAPSASPSASSASASAARSSALMRPPLAALRFLPRAAAAGLGLGLAHRPALRRRALGDAAALALVVDLEDARGRGPR